MSSSFSHQSLRTVISGSYRKHLRKLMQIKQILEGEGICVLSPVGSAALNEGAEFILLDADPVHDKRILQDSIFSKIRTSSFLTLANYDNYIGPAALIEIGYAIAFGIQVLTIEPVKDPNIAPYCRHIFSVFPEIEESLCNPQGVT